MDQGAIFLADYLIAAQASSFVSPESLKMKGITAAQWSWVTRVKLKSPLCEKKTRWPPQQTAAHATFVFL